MLVVALPRGFCSPTRGDEAEADEIQRTLNADRRHLTGEQLREHIVFLAQQTDERGVGKYSENTIAQVTGVDQKHVNRILVGC